MLVNKIYNTSKATDTYHRTKNKFLKNIVIIIPPPRKKKFSNLINKFGVGGGGG